MSAFNQGIQGVADAAPQIRNDISVFAINWFPNRNPLVTRSPRVPVGSRSYNIISRIYKPRTYTLGAAVADGVTTSITLTNASPLSLGDVLELATGERVQLTADPNITTNVITVLRGAEGTTAAAQSNGTTAYLIGNSRTGAEVDQNAAAYKPVAVTQYNQTFQYGVQVGGSLQGSSDFINDGRSNSPFSQAQMDALQAMMDDMETSSFYGIGDSGSSTGRPKQTGLKYQIPVGNRTTSPTNAGAYKPTDFIRDLLEKARGGGGNPDVVFLSTNFMSGLSIWSHQVLAIPVGTTIFGAPINVFEAPFLAGVTIIEAPLLRPFTAVALTSSEVRMRVKRNEFWQERGKRGDAFEGDWISECSVELANPTHHAWVEGITAFAAI